MTIGELLKTHRLRLGLTQKEMAADILTASYYSKVERNEHKISADDLFAILKKQAINPSEFMEGLIKETADTASFDKLNSAITLYYYQKNIKELEKMPTKIQANDQLSAFNRQLLLALNGMVLYNVTEDESYLTEENKQFLREEFFKLENWTSFKLSLYINIMEIYDLEANHAIVSSMLSKGIESYQIDDQLIILYILNNFTHHCLSAGSILLARHYNNLVLNKASNYNNILQKILAKYYDYVFEFLDDPSLEKEKQALDFIQVFKDINFGFYEPAIQLLDEIKDIYLNEQK